MKGLSRVAVTGTFVALFAMPVCAEPIEIPFRQHQHLVVVRGSANGISDLNLVIDTGATYTVISRQLAKRMKIRTDNVSAVSWGRNVDVRTGKLAEFAIGEAIFEDVEIRIGDLALARGMQVDVLVGLDLLKRTNVTIDYASQTLILGSNREFAEQAAFYPNLPFLLIRLEVQGKQLALVLDTGSPYLIFFRREIAGRVDMIRTKERARIAHAAGNLDLQKIILGETRLGERSLGAVSAYWIDASSTPYGGADGIFSPTSLGLQRLHLDFQSNRISWEF